MTNIGEELRKTREKKGFSVDDVAHATLIMQYYLEQIENNDFPRYDGYIASYIRKYANFLGLDGETFLDEYKHLFEEKKEEKPKKSKKPFYIILVILLSIALITTFIIAKNNNFWANRNTPSQEETTPQEPETPQNETPGETTQPEENTPETMQPETPTYEGVEVVLTGEGLCWLGIDADGSYSQKYIHKGETIKLKADKYIKIRFGNAPVVKVSVNGKDLGVVDAKNIVVDKEYKP